MLWANSYITSTYELAQIKLSSRLLAKNNPMNLPMNMNTQLCNHKSSKFQNTKSQKEQYKICIQVLKKSYLTGAVFKSLVFEYKAMRSSGHNLNLWYFPGEKLSKDVKNRNHHVSSFLSIKLSRNPFLFRMVHST